MTERRPDFNDFLHGLRERELRLLPAEARTVLHGGAAGSWYFRWFDENYPGTVERHIGVEAFAPKPDDLPDNVDWLPRTLGDMGPVTAGSVDMVFGGQVIEHLWPEDVAGLLVESHRVLRPGGQIVLDSPNRRVTEAIRWHHPEHTVEFAVDEVVELVRLAGFDVQAVRGVLLGYDAERHRFLGIGDLEADGVSAEDRATVAADRPEDAFIWWLVASRAARAPDRSLVEARAHERCETFRAARLRRPDTPLPVTHETGAEPVAAAPAEHAGPLLHGPVFPVDAGDWRATFALRRPPASVHPDKEIAWVDAASEAGERVHTRRGLRAVDIPADGIWREVALDVALERMTMGVEFRAFSRGVVPLEARLYVGLRRRRDAALPSGAEPRIRELAAKLARRTGEASRYHLRRRLRRG